MKVTLGVPDLAAALVLSAALVAAALVPAPGVAPEPLVEDVALLLHPATASTVAVARTKVDRTRFMRGLLSEGERGWTPRLKVRRRWSGACAGIVSLGVGRGASSLVDRHAHDQRGAHRDALPEGLDSDDDEAG